MARLHPILSGADKAAEHPFYLAAFLAKSAVRFRIQPADVMSYPKLRLQFG